MKYSADQLDNRSSDNVRIKSIHNNISSVFFSKTKPIDYVHGDKGYMPEFNDDHFSDFENIKHQTYRDDEDAYQPLSVTDRMKKSVSDINLPKYDPLTNSKSAFSNDKKTKNGNDEEEDNFEICDNGIDVFQRRPTKHMLPEIFLKGSTPIKNSKLIYSWTNFLPLSFLSGNTKFGFNKNRMLEVPSPIFIENENLMIKPNLSKESILTGMYVNDLLGLVLIDKEITKKFRGIIGDMISQIIQAAFLGRPMSLPVRLFEPKSTLQRITDYWTFAPQFLTNSFKANSPIERMKWAMAFAVSGFYIPTKQLKPFNPLIGETFQGEFENGSKVYVEHISHYPTVSRFLINDENFRVHGYFEFNTKSESFGSRLNVYQKGPITIEFPKYKQKIIYNMPVVKLLNAKSEENRSAIWVESMIFVDTINNLRGVIKLGNNSKYIHGLEGYITEWKYAKDYKYNVDAEMKEAGKDKKPKEKILSQIRGSWLKEIVFDEVEYWNIDKFTPNWLRPIAHVLPSDGRFREDLIWLFRSFYDSTNEQERKLYEDYSQSWKVTIEKIQRAERETRKKNKK